ncbi:MAG: methyltransferase domain-containing protein [Methanobacteriaceae archaeon]|nr:methyltransferase domain-containing protein [Methanobacteriaceae archaeon]
MNLDKFNINNYDFIDFGCSNGNSLNYGVNKFNGNKGIGIDIDPEKIKNLKKEIKDQGHIGLCMDILELKDYTELRKQFKFTTCIHFLEHLGGGFLILKKCLRLLIK